MGMNTACMILNDHLHQIKDDREFGRKVYDYIISSGKSNRPLGFKALPYTHADYNQVVVVSGNGMRYLGGYNGTWTDTDLQIVKFLADEMGYRLVKKPRK